MERIYNEINGYARFNQTGVSNFPAVSSRSAVRQPKTSQNVSIKNKILSKLSDEMLETLLNAGKSVYLKRGENIYRPEDAVRCVYFPETAVFSESKILADGRTMEIIMTGKEGVNGVASLIKANPEANFTQILQGGHALQVKSDWLRGKLNDDGELKEVIFDYFNRFIEQISTKVICNGFHLIENRLCAWLLMLQDRIGGSQLILTQEQIAAALGAHRPSITQITKKLREEQIIAYTRGTIFILDQNKLQAAACSCYVDIN